MTISFYLKRPSSDIDTSIYAILFYEGLRMKYYTPEKILPKHWNKDAQKAKQTDKFREHSEFNQRLQDWKSDVGNIYRKWINNNKVIPNTATLKELLDKELKKVEAKKELNETFTGYFQQLINETKEGIRLQPKSGKPYSKNTVKAYTTTFNTLTSFAATYKPIIDFKNINLDFYANFTRYLTKDLKFTSNTIGKHIKIIKVVMNDATERGVNTNMQFRSRKFSVTSENTDALYLNEKEVREIENLDLSKNKRLDNVRDLFLVGCYTGLRYSDFSILKPEQIQDGFIETTQIKTGDPVVIPIHPTVEKILAKYDGQLPRSISNQKTNEYLKELGKLIPSLNTSTSKTFTKGGLKVTNNHLKWEILSSHTARRSFATNEYLAGTPSITIMAITGHKTEKAFLRYIKLTPNEHAKLLKLHWQNRDQLKAV
ncbi:site-specific integrase [Segetibacter aerophilus]|uniref:Tyr recombinase domain-containing protein n=1 Tax=Segetibacter aerophilus TaxID=670293 RepID=A0A512BC00_9BACT|nr:site-specific integrase [Segetibacter aerophilus]GEO09488.1 hypothetical protein SAE01_19840 [Segetibacter aerophilus]